MPIRLSDESTADFGLQRASKNRSDRCLFANCIHPDNSRVECESLEADREATPASHDSGRYWLCGARSGEGHDRWCRFAFSLTNRVRVWTRIARNSRGRVGCRPKLVTRLGHQTAVFFRPIRRTAIERGRWWTEIQFDRTLFVRSNPGQDT